MKNITEQFREIARSALTFGLLLRKTRILVKLKRLIIFGSFAGPLMAFGSIQKIENLNSIQQNGVTTVAAIKRVYLESTNRPKGKKRKPLVVDLAWKDAQGNSRVSKGVELSSWLSGELRGHLKVTGLTVEIRYLQKKRRAKIFVIRDFDYQLQKYKSDFKTALIFSIISMFAWFGIFISKNRKN